MEMEPSMNSKSDGASFIARSSDYVEQAFKQSIESYRDYLIKKSESKRTAAEKQRIALERYEKTGRLFA
jgi:hypothetical protein